jgi:hypothetical protein
LSGCNGAGHIPVKTSTARGDKRRRECGRAAADCDLLYSILFFPIPQRAVYIPDPNLFLQIALLANSQGRTTLIVSAFPQHLAGSRRGSEIVSASISPHFIKVFNA